jgi:beta-mannosidase
MPDPSVTSATTDLLADAQWQLAVLPAGQWCEPADITDPADWLPACVPGTAAEALERAGRFDRTAPMPLHDKDVWYRCQVAPACAGRHRLVAEGLATICEAWLDGAPILISDSMYAPCEVLVDLDGPAELIFCFRALAPHLKKKGPRARWKTKLVCEPGLRLVRTTFLGHMPGWSPEIHAVGPWRPVALVREDETLLHGLRILADLAADGTGRLSVCFTPGRGYRGDASARVSCAGGSADLVEDETGTLHAHLELAGVAPWWPHTHGTPTLHDVMLDVGDDRHRLGRTGFRRIEVERDADGAGFGLRINGVSVFARGAVWTSADIAGLPGTREAYLPWLRLAREGNMNMLRIGGTMAPEARPFFEICDELGILVWQDLPFANLDYPATDPVFAETVRAETEALLSAGSFAPSLAVICGGSEMHQQGAMMGLPESRWKGPLTEEILPDVAARVRPDVPYVANSPSGGTLPFSPNAGIAHYYGVGAYRRPLEDARRANVRFAGECLAFSNVPEPASLAGAETAPCHHPDWKRGVPRDRDVGWDFEDVRDHYVRDLYGVDPLDLRYGDPASYLDHGRAAVAEVMEATFAEWRRPGSSCRGALVWTFQDLMPGAGWGVVSCDGQPKSAFHALARAFAPLRLSVTDEGTNGLAIHVANDLPAPRRLKLRLACLRHGALAIASGETEIGIDAHGAASLAATDLIGAFFDVTHAFRFGPPAHDCVHVWMEDVETGELLDEAFHFPLGRAKPAGTARIEARVEAEDGGGYRLCLSTDRVARSVAILDEAFLPEDNWFHLAPGRERVLRLSPRDGGTDARPGGTVRALNADPVSYSAA